MNAAARTRLIGMVWLLLACLPAHAQIISVVASPPAANVPLGQSVSVQLRWQVTAYALGGSRQMIRSSEGVFRAGGSSGRVLGVNNRTIQRMVRPAAPGTAVAVVPESLLVPARVVLRAQALGVTRIAYQRTFTDGTASSLPVTSAIMLNLTGGLGANFGITRVALRFPDGSRQKVVAAASETFVLADINHTGSGRLVARWEVAEPVTTRGRPVFRTLAIVRRQLIGSGARTTIRSPDLPTQGDGAYLVRLRIINPRIGFDSPVLRYFVNPALNPVPTPSTIVARSPAAGADYANGMRFAWQPLATAVVYRLEFHDKAPPRRDTDPVGGSAKTDAQAAATVPLTRPVSGIVVSAAIDAVELSPLALAHLSPDHSYWWRVVAFDERGRLIGRSSLRQIHVPPGTR